MALGRGDLERDEPVEEAVELPGGTDDGEVGLVVDVVDGGGDLAPGERLLELDVGGVGDEFGGDEDAVALHERTEAALPAGVRFLPGKAGVVGLVRDVHAEERGRGRDRPSDGCLLLRLLLVGGLLLVALLLGSLLSGGLLFLHLLVRPRLGLLRRSGLRLLRRLGTAFLLGLLGGLGVRLVLGKPLPCGEEDAEGEDGSEESRIGHGVQGGGRLGKGRTRWPRSRGLRLIFHATRPLLAPCSKSRYSNESLNIYLFI